MDGGCELLEPESTPRPFAAWADELTSPIRSQTGPVRLEGTPGRGVAAADGDLGKSLRRDPRARSTSTPCASSSLPHRPGRASAPGAVGVSRAGIPLRDAPPGGPGWQSRDKP